ncbi:MAG TPA: N-6 DNA methylase, partial [Nocardioides sp.]|nr:N-6 DNA methylase [Nocardioides sp.]
MRELRDGVVEAARVLGGGGVPAALGFACAEIADARGVLWGQRGSEEVCDALAAWREPGAEQHLGAVHESLMTGRKEAGAFYTPAFLVEQLLEETLVPLLSPGQRVRVLDPACGTGAFLLPAARRIAQTVGVPLADAIACVHGVDLDPVAVEIARFLLWLEGPSVPRTVLDANLVVGDGLALAPDASYDVVVGNPPVLNQLRTATVRESSVEGVGPYTDTSALFLL